MTEGATYEAAALLRASRRRAGLSQRELARRAGMSAAAVCLYERGERAPRVDTLARLVAATGGRLVLSVEPTIDVERNARVLVEVLDLAHRLPTRPPARTLPAPVLRDLAV